MWSYCGEEGDAPCQPVGLAVMSWLLVGRRRRRRKGGGSGGAVSRWYDRESFYIRVRWFGRICICLIHVSDMPYDFIASGNLKPTILIFKSFYPGP